MDGGKSKVISHKKKRVLLLRAGGWTREHWIIDVVLPDFKSIIEIVGLVDIIKTEFDSQLIVLPDQNYQISGRMVRDLKDGTQTQLFANMHIKPNN